jgi:hypothetical protein
MALPLFLSARLSEDGSAFVGMSTTTLDGNHGVILDYPIAE